MKIVSELRKLGISVLDLGAVGGGCGDILVGKGGSNWLFEIKNPKASNTDKKLTSAEKAFHAAWRGQVHIIETAEQVLEVIGALSGARLP